MTGGLERRGYLIRVYMVRGGLSDQAMTGGLDLGGLGLVNHGLGLYTL